MTLIERGVCRDVVYDAQTATRAGRRSTGHGLPAPNSYGPFPLNMLMAPGDASHEELVRGLDRGLLVTRFHYTNPVHPKLAIVTGMTRDGLFLVERGEIVGPVRNLRFTQSYLAALAGVEAVGRDRRRVSGDFSRRGRPGRAHRGLHLHGRHGALSTLVTTPRPVLDVRLGDRVTLARPHPCGARDLAGRPRRRRHRPAL